MFCKAELREDHGKTLHTCQEPLPNDIRPVIFENETPQRPIHRTAQELEPVLQVA